MATKLIIIRFIISTSLGFNTKMHVDFRDIKPDNILVDYQEEEDRNPKIKIADFGFAEVTRIC